MKKILFSIFGLMSFTTSADTVVSPNTNMLLLWEQKLVGIDRSYLETTVRAYCVFEGWTDKVGTTFIYSFSGSKLVSVEQLMADTTAGDDRATVVVCKRDTVDY